MTDFPIIAILDDDEGGNKVEKTLASWQSDGLKIEMYIPEFNTLINYASESCYVDDLDDDKLAGLFKFIENPFETSNL